MSPQGDRSATSRRILETGKTDGSWASGEWSRARLVFDVGSQRIVFWGRKYAAGLGALYWAPTGVGIGSGYEWGIYVLDVRTSEVRRIAPTVFPSIGGTLDRDAAGPLAWTGAEQLAFVCRTPGSYVPPQPGQNNEWPGMLCWRDIDR